MILPKSPLVGSTDVRIHNCFWVSVAQAFAFLVDVSLKLASTTTPSPTPGNQSPAPTPGTQSKRATPTLSRDVYISHTQFLRTLGIAWPLLFRPNRLPNLLCIYIFGHHNIYPTRYYYDLDTSYTPAPSPREVGSWR